jgi:hypothetical protein
MKMVVRPFQDCPGYAAEVFRPRVVGVGGEKRKLKFQNLEAFHYKRRLRQDAF